MRRRRRAVVVLAATAVLVGAGGAGGLAGADSVPKPSSPSAAVQVTDNPAPLRAHSSPQIAVNPKNGELVTVESDVRGSRACSVHISTDRGRTWFPGGDAMVEPFRDCGFYAEYGPLASLTFAEDGTLYVAFVASEFLNRVRNETPRHVFMARSSDSGRTFTTTKVFDAPDRNIERGLNKGPMVAVDPTNPRQVYVGWRQGINAPTAVEKLKSNVAASSDGGRTWGPPVDVTDDRGADFPAIAVDRLGTVHAAFWVRVFPATPAGQAPPIRPIVYRQSTDNGKTWSPPVDVDPGNRSAGHPPMLVADPRTDDVYLAWNANAEVENTVQGFAGDLDLFVRVSHDLGKTWSERITVSDESVKANQYEPGIVVGPDSTVHMAWYDFRNSPTAPLITTGHSGDTGVADVYYSYSIDNGDTWATGIRVNDRGIDRSKGVWSNNIDSKANVGIGATEDEVYFAWQDTRNAIGSTDSEDIYVASISLTGSFVTPVDEGIPAWTLFGTAVLGLGIGICVAWLIVRKRLPATPVGAPKGEPVKV